MRRAVGYHKNWFAGVKSDRNFDRASIGRVNAADKGQRNVGPLIFFDSAIIFRLKKRESSRGINRPALQFNVRAVLMRAYNVRTVHNGIRADHSENEAAVTIRNNQTRTRFYLFRFGEFGKAGSACPA